MSSSTNIVVGVSASGTVKAADYGAQESAATDLGFIKGGVSIEHEETSYDIKVDQVLAPIDKVTTDESLKIKFSLSEATLENIALALGVSVGSASSGKIEFGDKSANIIKTLFINVKGPGSASRKYTFWRCRPSGKTGQTYKRDGETLIEAEFDVLADMSKERGKRFGMIEDI